MFQLLILLCLIHIPVVICNDEEDDPYVIELRSDTFDDVVNDPQKNVIVKFTSDWCPHCRQLAPIYEKLGKTFKAVKDCVIAEVSNDRGNGGKIMQRYGVQGLPEIWFFSKTDKKGEKYKGGRSHGELFRYFSEKCASESDGDDL